MNLLEMALATIKKDVSIDLGVEATYHGIDRENRPGSPIIYKTEIIATINNGLSRLIMMILTGKLKLENGVVIKDTLTDLNIVGRFTTNGRNKLKFVIITIMKKKKFYTKPNDVVIHI